IHRAMLYADDDAFLDAALPFLTEGLDTGEAVLVVAPAATTAGVRRALGPAAGAVAFRDSAHWYTQPTRTIAAYSSFIEDHPGVRIRVLAEPGWECGSEAEIAEWTRYESIVNQAFAEVDAAVLCLYDRRTTAAEVLDGVLRTHPE